MLKEPDREANSQLCIWVQRGGPPDQPLVLFHNNRSKAAKVAETLLEDHEGYLQVDGNATYDTLGRVHRAIRLVGCMAHARRKFFEANKVQGKRSWKWTLALSALPKRYLR